MELQNTHNSTLSSPSLCVPSSVSPCLQHIHSSLTFPSRSRCPSRFTCCPSRTQRPPSFCIIAKARQSESKAPPPRQELWELREYEDPDEDENDEQKKSKGRRRTFETEVEARRHHWISRMWAPWEEALSPEAQFAVDALNLDQGDEPIVPMEMMDRLNVNKPLIPDAIFEGKEEIPEDPDVIEARENGALPGTAWKSPMVFSLIPPRDWPPPGWKVDPDELAFIRSIHGIMETRVTPFDLSTAVPETEENKGSHPRWRMFMKQYEEWVAANKERLDREAKEVGDEYYPGRRRMGKDYVDGMYELPFIYPGQHYAGQVTMIHLYEGAHVNFGAVHDGWVPIKRNDWYWIRKHIKVGMRVQVEVVAKRDPYRFRFPVELRFVYPNIDHLIFNRFEYPPIFVRAGEEKNMDLVTREAGRPFWPRRRPDPEKKEEEVPKYNHPFSFKVWQLHVAEQMLLDEEERKAAGIVTPPHELSEVTTAERDYLDADTFWTEEELGGETFQSLVLTQHEWELDMDAARKEREAIKKAREEAKAKGKPFESPKLRRTVYIEELDIMNWQRYLDEHEAVQRDKVNRLEFGMPLEEPGKYADDSFFGENKYNPREKRWRHDYVGDVSKSKDDGKQQRGPQPLDDEGRAKEDGRSGRRGSRAMGSPGSIKDAAADTSTTSVRKSGETTGNGEKVVNGTESSRIPDVRGFFIPKAEDNKSEDETD
eukprot:c24042_g1_i1 orf=105-2234(+)